MLRTFAWLAAAGSVLWLSAAAALGLGEIDVKTRLNQRFVGVIQITSVTADEAESVQVNLASNEDFARAGIERTEYLSSLKFAVRREGGSASIAVTSAQVAREPYLSFLLEVRGANSRVLREYTVLLDPPDLPTPAPAPVKVPATTEFYETPEEQARRMAPPRSAAPAVVAAEVPTPAAMPDPTPTPYPSAAPATVTAPSVYGPVQAGETLWSIAAKLRPDPSISMDQVLLAIYQGNPGAFTGFQGLRKGAVLNVPAAEQMRAVGASAAKSRVSILRGGARAAPRPAAAVAQPPTLPILPPASPAVEKPLPPIPTAKPTPVVTPPPVVATPTPPPAPEALIPPPSPVVIAPAVPTAEPIGAVTPAVEPTLIPTDEPLIPPPTAAVEPTAIATPVPVIAAPLEPEAGSNFGFYPGILIALLVLGAGGFFGWRYWKERQQGVGADEDLAYVPSRRNRPLSDAVAVADAGKTVPATSFGDLPDFDGTPATSAGADQVMSTSLATQAFEATTEQPAHKFDTTQGMRTSRMDSNAAQVMEAPSQPSERVDFDVTSNFATETMSINLDANDPVSEADFHLAYGLYDEAAMLLKQAAEKDPGRTEVRVKLAETYFAASRPAEFQATAEGLKGQIPESDWQKLAIMGRQLVPDAAIFAGSGDDALGGSDFDLSFDEPESPAASPSKAAKAAPAPVQDLGGGLDFKLEELELAPLDEPQLEMPSAPSSSSVNFEVKDFDFNSTSPGTAEVGLGPNSTQAVAMQSSTDDLRLDDFDLNDASTAISAGDEISTKLDLARAYADMGDNDMARTLLKEVMQQGSATQQKEAQGLIGRLV